MNKNNNSSLSQLARIVTDARPDLTEMMTMADELSRANADAAHAGKSATELFDETMALGEKRANEARRRVVAEFAQKGLPSQNSLNPGWTFESMAPWAQEPENRGRIARAWAFCDRFGEHHRAGGMAPGLLIIGATGSGKSHLSGAIAHEVHKRHPDATIIFTTLSALIKSMIDRYSNERRDLTADPYMSAAECDLLIIEDAVSPGIKESDFRNEQLGNLLRDRRNACKATVVTLNAILGELQQRIGAHAYAGLQEMAENVINLGQTDHRKSLAEKAALDGAGNEREIDTYLAAANRERSHDYDDAHQEGSIQSANYGSNAESPVQPIFGAGTNVRHESSSAWQPSAADGVSDLSDGYPEDGYQYTSSGYDAMQSYHQEYDDFDATQSPEPYFAHKSPQDLMRVGICTRDAMGRLLANLNHEVWTYTSAMQYAIAIARLPIVGTFNPMTAETKYFSDSE